MAERIPVMVVLLVLQAAAGLLGAVVAVMVALALATGAAVLPALAGAALPLLLAIGLVGGWRWARTGTAALEFVLLTGYAVSLLLGLLPAVETETGLAALLANVALPAAVLGLLLSPVPEERR